MARKKSTSLRKYAEKRDFSVTPEPRPARAASGQSVLGEFVVHRHDARRLHYDLRLEMDGVLKSWAVPKGLSHIPRDKRLAVRTEDHPLKYLDFDGNIPSGQYGAGTMVIWDRGTFEFVNDADGLAGLNEGKLELRLFGARFRGEWHMVRLKDSPNEWLIFKTKDRYARADGEPPLSLPLLGRRRIGFPRRVEAMKAGRSVNVWKTIRAESDWIFELKVTGRRVLVRKQDDRIAFTDAAGKRLSWELPELDRDLRRLRATHAILDGALCCTDANGRPSVALLRRALSMEPDARRREGVEIGFHAWDLLHFDQWNIRPFPLIERKAALRSIVPAGQRVVCLEHSPTLDLDVLQSVADAGMPGLIAKRVDSAYTAGRSRAWLEVPAQQFPTCPFVHNASPLQRSVRITNRQKVLWPREGFTKGDLLDYYDRISPILLPHLRGRPLSLNRFPDGIEGESFYQKDVGKNPPDWIETITVPTGSARESIRYVVCHDRETLLHVANLGSIELHPWLSRKGAFDEPDWAILDLDPFGAPFDDVVTIARAIHDILEDAGLLAFPKTSGSKGLHIYIPLAPGYTYAQSRMFCEAVARLVVSRHRSIATVERVKSERVGLVYVDFLQNRRGQTIAAPYSARPVPGARVSAPLDWSEVCAGLDPLAFTIRTMPDRVAVCGDLFGDVLTEGQDLLTAIDSISAQASRQM